jgi:hypothetical protein
MINIIRNFGVGVSPAQKLQQKSQAIVLTNAQGTSKVPQPPVDLFTQSGPRGILLNWRMPSGFNSDIAGWKVYKDNESTLFSAINNPNTTQVFIESSSGTQPPVTNLFVSSINKMGIESAKVNTKSAAAVEASAPPMPTTPPTYQIPNFHLPPGIPYP